MNRRALQNQTPSGAGVEWLLAKARRAIRDARNSRLSPSLRYQCAYDAALQCALAFAAATNDQASFGVHTHRAAFRHLLNGLALEASAWHATTVWVTHRYLERQLGLSVANEAVAECATNWAALLHAATTKRLTKQRDAAQL